MIMNNTLTHGDFLSPLQSWRPGVQVFNAFFIAALTTVLSYQVAASFIDIALGWKEHFKTTAPNFHIKLLSDEFSFLAISTALLRRDSLDRLRFRHSISREAEIDRHGAPIRWATILKLFLLLLVPQIVNLLSIVLSIERDKVFSVAEAKFDGVSFGINANGSTIRPSGGWRSCLKLDFQSRVPDAHNIAEFFTCFIVSCDYEGGEDFQKRELDLSLWSTPQGEVSVHVNADITDGASFYNYYGMSSHGVITSEGRTYRVKQSLDAEEALSLFMTARNVLAENCTSATIAEPDVINSADLIKVSQRIPCEPLTFKRVVEGTDDVYRRLTFVESDRLLVAREEEFLGEASASPSFTSGENIPLMIVRNSPLNGGALLVAVAVAITLRVLLKLILRNDVDYGIEASLKAALGVPSHHSLIYSDLKVKYEAADMEEAGYRKEYDTRNRLEMGKLYQLEYGFREGSSDSSSSDCISTSE